MKEEYIGILLAGSLAHGHANAGSGVGVILISEDGEYRRRETERKS